jgi:ABC-type branched-subunit amino acid transport system substrate-binding protein
MMSQNDSSRKNTDLPDSASSPSSSLADTPTVPLPPADKKETSSTSGFKIEQIFVFVLFIILLILFSSNPIVFSSLTGLLTLLTIGSLENVSNKLIEYIGKPFNWLIRPFVWLFLSLFASTKALRRHRRSITNSIIAIILAITLAMTTLHSLLISTVGNVNDYLCLQQTVLPWSACNSGLGISTLPNGVNIGLITNATYGEFDQTSLNQSEQQVEKLIFQDNATACVGTHITLAVVTMLSRTVEDPSADATIGTEDLQGAYLAQNSYDSQHPQIQLCLAITNLGTSDTANKNSQLVTTHPNDYSLPQIIHRLAQFARSDASFRGIMGFPFSQQSLDALQILKSSPQLKTIPVISPSSSSDNLSDISNFYRMVSPDQSQSQILAQFLCGHLVTKSDPSAQLAIFADSSDAYSHSLQLTFENSVNCLPTENIVAYQNDNAQSIQKAVYQALIVDHATYLFFPGYNSDLDTLQLAIRNLMRDRSNTITVIGGDGLYDLDGTTTHYIYSPVYSTTFASPLATDSPQINTFIKAYQQQGFAEPYLANSIPGYTLLPPHTLLSNDATTAFIKTLQQMSNPNFTQSSFNATLATITFTGVSGTIELQGDQTNTQHISDRDTGDIYITCADQFHTIHLITKYQSVNATATVEVQENPLSGNFQLCAP